MDSEADLTDLARALPSSAVAVSSTVEDVILVALATSAN